MSQPARAGVANVSEGDASPQPGNKPVDKIRIGKVTANIWNNPSDKGDFTPSRSSAATRTKGMPGKAARATGATICWSLPKPRTKRMTGFWSCGKEAGRKAL